MLRKALLLLALVLICSGTALAQVGGIQAQQTASNPLQLRITDGDVTSTLGTYTFKATNVLLTASATNYVYLDLTTTPPTLTVNTTGFPASNYYAIDTVTTNSKQITAMTDSRPSFNSAAFSAGGSSGLNSFGVTFGDSVTGAALTNSEVRYFRVPFACSIKAWSITADAGTATIKFARVNGGTALPTIGANSISTSGVSLASGTAVYSQTLTDFTTTTLAAGDWVGVFITTVATAKQIQVQLDCQ